MHNKDVSSGSRCWVEVSRSQIASNYRSVRTSVGDAIETAGVVKADAYGHGMVEVARVLASEGARWLAVSSVEEGVTLRRAGIDLDVLVMAGVLPPEREAVVEHHLTPAVHSLSELPELDAAAARVGHPLRFHLKIDSGMGRLGTRATAEQIADAIRPLTSARLEGLMTHFASAADFDSRQTEAQIAYFNFIADGLAAQGITPAYLHLSSTNAIAYPRPDALRVMVRPGHAIYGYVSPARGKAPVCTLRVKPALSWKTRIIAVKDVPEGTLIGYGGSYRTTQPMRIAILAAGYADGIPHRLSNRGKVIAGGKLTSMLGTVSMDLTTIDVSHAPHLKPGDIVTLLGTEGHVSLDAQQIAKTAGTISYNVLCGISARVKRVYV
jgi:alanine racemase